jgi:uncharacterized membrane protein
MQQMMYKTLMITLFLLIAPMTMIAHGDEHNDTTEQTSSDNLITTESTARSDAEVKSESNDENTAVFKPFSEFPNLHPLVVHFPIVLILLAFLSQLASFFVFRKQLSWVTILLLIGGLLGAFMASSVFHPHTTGLSENMMEMLEAHEFYASLTTWLAAIALLIKLISHFALSRKMWAEIVVLAVLAGSAVTVSLAGHLGAQMVHVEDIGPKGNYLEQHEE